MSLLAFVRAPLAVLGMVVDVAVQMRAQNRAVAAAMLGADQLAEREAETEVLEPAAHAFFPCGVLAPDRDALLPYKCSLRDGHDGNHVAWAGKLPIAEWTDGDGYVSEPSAHLSWGIDGATTDSAQQSIETLRSSQWPDGSMYTCECGHQAEQHPRLDGISEEHLRPCGLCRCLLFRFATTVSPAVTDGVPPPSAADESGEGVEHTAPPSPPQTSPAAAVEGEQSSPVSGLWCGAKDHGTSAAAGDSYHRAIEVFVPEADRVPTSTLLREAADYIAAVYPACDGGYVYRFTANLRNRADQFKAVEDTP